jgi:hypothetical protein
MDTGATLIHPALVLRSLEALSSRSLQAASITARGSERRYRSMPWARRNALVRAASRAGKDRRHRTKGPLRCRLCGHERRRHGRIRAAVRAPSAPGHSVHGSRTACRSRPPRSRSGCPLEERSQTQTPEDTANDGRIHIAFKAYPYLARQLDMDRLAAPINHLLKLSIRYCPLFNDVDRQQLHRAHRRRTQLPSRYKRRHWKTWFAFTPYLNATRATDAPASSVSSTIRLCSAALRRRRRPFNNPPLKSTSIIHTSSRLNNTMYTRPTPGAYSSTLCVNPHYWLLAGRKRERTIY